MVASHRSIAKNLWCILFELQGSVWTSVLPFCLVNCALMFTIEILALWGIRIAFSPTGHGLMTLIISFLVVAKVNISYDRFMSSRHSIGHALACLRELNQTALVFTQHKQGQLAKQWAYENIDKIVDLLDCTIRVIQDDRQSDHLARNDYPESSNGDDPMVHVQALRSHLYHARFNSEHHVAGSTDSTNTGDTELQLLERMKLLDLLNEFVIHYRNLLKFASTPVPFSLLQMGRTFLFLWTFSIPFVLRGVVEERYTAMVFVFFLTYGFIGLELVAMKLVNPFGDDGKHDLNVSGMREATILGMEHDLLLFGKRRSVLDKRTEYRRQNKRRVPAVTSIVGGTDGSGRTRMDVESADDGDGGGGAGVGPAALYHSMGGDSSGALYGTHS